MHAQPSITHQYEHQLSAPNTALAIYQHPTSASTLLNASPIRFTLQAAAVPPPSPQPHLSAPDLDDEEEDEVDAALKADLKPGPPGADEMFSSNLYKTPNRRSPSTSSDNGTKTATTTTTPKDTASKSPTAQAPKTAPTVREFQVTADWSTFNHQAYIERQVQYGGYDVDLKTLVAEDLAASVPVLGMADVLARKVEVPGRIQSRRAEELGRGKSLREMWEEGMRGERGVE